MKVEWHPVAQGLQFPEGPVVLADGTLLIVEIKRGTLTSVRPNGACEIVAHCGGGPNGAAVGPDGRIFVCNNGGFEWQEAHGLTIPTGRASDYSGGRIQVVDPGSGTVCDLFTGCAGAALRGPNDLVFDRHGGFYFTDTGKHDSQATQHGALYYALANGSAIRQLAYGLSQPNGCGLSPDGGTLYFSETNTARVWRFDVAEPGQVRGGATPFAAGNANFLFGSPRYEFFDSMAIEAGGNLCVATLFSGGITIVSPAGQLVDFVPGPGDPGITNLCFSPIDPSLAYLTASCTGVVYQGRWPRPGLPAVFC